MDMSRFALHALATRSEDIRGFMGDVAEMGKLHLQLLAEEAVLEKARLKRQAILLSIAGLGIAMAVLFTLSAIIVLAWDTPYRMHAVIGVPLVLWISTVAVAVLFYRETVGHKPFARTAEELRKDGAWLMSLL